MELVYGKDRIIMEIGTAYDPKTAVYDGKVEKRSKNWLKDALRLKNAPKVAGLYSKADLLDYPLLSAEDSEYNTAVFVTHLHLDHMSAMGMVSPLIPVYLSEQAQTIEYALADVGQGVEGHRRKYTSFNDHEVIRIGEIEVLPLMMFGDSYQDFSFYVKTPDMKLHYTGDLVLHSTYADKILEEMEFIKNENIDILVCDTTAFMDSIMEMIYGDVNAKIVGTMELPEKLMSQAMVEEQLRQTILQQKSTCVVNFYVREMEEVADFTTIAKEGGRQLVLEPETAHIARSFFKNKPYVYIPDYEKYENNKEQWFKELLNNCIIVSNEELIQHPEKYLLQNTYVNILELLDLPNEDAAYIHYGGEPLGDYDPAFFNMMRVLELANFKYYGIGGNDNYFSHSYPFEVKYYVDQIDPSILIPCHGYNPERLLTSSSGIQVIIEEGRTYELTEDKKNLQEC